MQRFKKTEWRFVWFHAASGGGEYFQKQPTKANISISQDNPVLYPTNINVLYHSVPSLYTINHITHYVVDNSNIK